MCSRAMSSILVNIELRKYYSGRDFDKHLIQILNKKAQNFRILAEFQVLAVIQNNEQNMCKTQ